MDLWENPSYDNYVLRTSVRFDIETVGLHDFLPVHSGKVYADYGLMVGFHYEDIPIGVISQAFGGYNLTPTGYSPHDLSNYVSKRLYDSELNIGSRVIKSKSSSLRLPALKLHLRKGKCS